MAQASPRDLWHVAAPAVRGQQNEAFRVAATYGSSNSPTEPAVREAIDAGAAQLVDAGYEAEFVDPPDLDQILGEWQSTLATETSVTALDQSMSIASDHFNKILTWMFQIDSLPDLAGDIEALTRRATILRRWGLFLDQHPSVSAPASQLVPFVPNDDASTSERFLEFMTGHTPLVAASYLGLSSVAVPTLLTDGGPFGVQVIGRSFREDQFLDAATAVEARVGVMAEKLWPGKVL
jgi:amidase